MYAFGLRCEKDGRALWVKKLTFKADDPSKLVGGTFHVDEAEWTEDPNKAVVHRGKWHAEWQARQLRELEGIECEIVDLDTVEGYDNPVGKWDVPLPEGD